MDMVRWIVTDRKTGERYVIPHPRTDEERDTLRVILSNVSAYGLRR